MSLHHSLLRRLLAWFLFSMTTAAGQPLRVLFLGGIGSYHRSDSLNKVLAQVLVPYGVQMTYTENPAEINRANLAGFDLLFLFNELGGKVEAAHAADLVAFVEGGKGVVISHIGINTGSRHPAVDSLFGARFLSHGRATFTPEILLPSHPALAGVSAFSSYDETYVHRVTNRDRLVLAVRNETGKPPEPWTWVRTQGRGRVYYTAAGHGSNVWVLPAFQKQIAVAMHWASGKDLSSAIRPLPLSFPRGWGGIGRSTGTVFLADPGTGADGVFPWSDLRGRILLP